MGPTLETIFIATGFAPTRRKRAQLLAALLTEAGFCCEMGEGFGGTSVANGVRDRIASSSCVIALIEPSNRGKREPTQWLIQEVACAIGLNKCCLVLVEKRARFSRGLLGDAEFISFRASSFASVLPQVFHQLNVILHKQGRAIGIKETSDPRLHISNEPTETECNDLARAQMKTASKLTMGKQFDLALEHAKLATELDKNCWQAWIKYGGLLMKVGRLIEGVKIHSQVWRDFKGNQTAGAAAKHNLAVAKELQFGLESERGNMEAEALYECSLKLDPYRVYTRAALVCVYLRLKKLDRAHALLEGSAKYNGFIPAMRQELDESVDGMTLLARLPVLAQNLLYPITVM